MACSLFVYAAEVRFTTLFQGLLVDYVGTVDVETLTGGEALGLMTSALYSEYPHIDALIFRQLPSAPIDSIESADDYSRFGVGERVLVANPVNNMIEPLPAYSAWEMREIQEVLAGGPVVWLDKELDRLYYTLTPYGVRKVHFDIHSLGS